MNYARLGRLAKAKAPGAYDDYTDEELGQDLADAGYTETNFETDLSMTDKAPLDPRTKDEFSRAIDEVEREMQRKAVQYSNDTGWFAGIKADSAMRRAQMFQNRALELNALFQLRQNLNQLKLQPEIAYTQWLTEKTLQLEVSMRGRMAELASDLGMSLANYELYIQQKNAVAAETEKEYILSNIRREEAKHAQELRMEEEREKHRVEIERLREEANIRQDERERQIKADLEKEKEEGRIELEWETRAVHFETHDRIKELTKRVGEILAEMEQLRNNIDLDPYTREIQLIILQDSLNAFIGEKRHLEAGLYKTPDKEKAKSTEAGTGTGRNPKDPR